MIISKGGQGWLKKGTLLLLYIIPFRLTPPTLTHPTHASVHMGNAASCEADTPAIKVEVEEETVSVDGRARGRVAASDDWRVSSLRPRGGALKSGPHAPRPPAGRVESTCQLARPGLTSGSLTTVALTCPHLKAETPRPIVPPPSLFSLTPTHTSLSHQPCTSHRSSSRRKPPTTPRPRRLR